MKLLDFQLVSLFTLLGVSLVGVAVPFYFGPGPRGEYLLSLGNAFAGGVMLGAGFLHMLVDASDDLSTLEVFNSTTFLPHLLSVVGILIPFALEKSGLLFFRDGETSKLTDGNDGGALGGDVEAMGSPAGRERARSVGNSTDHARARPATRSHSMSERISLAGRQRRLSAHVSLLAMKSAVHKALAHSDSAQDSYDAHVSYGAVDDADGMGAPSVAAAQFANFMMLAILSIHSILAGLAVGVSGSASGFGILIALLVHKLFEALVMGVSTVKARQSLATRTAEITVYVLATPLGVLIGLIVSSFGTIPAHTVGIIVGISSGTFIYIALVEIMCDEFEGDSHRVGKFWMFCIGVAGMAVLGVYV